MSYLSGRRAIGTLGTLTIDDITVDGNTINSTGSSTLAITPKAGQSITFDGTVTLDAGVIAGATSITSTVFVGDITGDVTGNTSGTAATVTTAAQTNITSLGTLTALTIDDVAINGKVITMTGSSSDTAVFTVATNGTLSIVTTDDAAAAANITITADGTFEVDGTTITLDSSGDIDLNADGGDVFLKDASTTYGSLTNTSGNLIIKSGTTTAATFSGANVTLAGTVGSGAITSTGVVTATGFTIGSAVIVESELELLDGLTAGTAIASKVVTTDSNIDTTGQRNLTITGELDAATLDISGNADIDGTMEADAYTVDGTALNEYISDTVGAMVGSNTETGITVTYQDGDNTLDFVIGTLNQDTTGTAAKVTVTDSTANTNFPVIFQDESNALLDDTGALRYNPSTGTLLVPNLTVAGTTTQVDTVTMNAQNAVVFEGATADEYETTLSIVDPTADHTQYLINQGGYIPVLAVATTTAITSTPAELNLLDTASANSVVNSKAVIYGSSGEVAGTLSTAAQTNITSLGTLSSLTSGNITLNAQADLRFADGDSSNWVAFQAPATVSSNITWTLPAADAGTSGFALVSNGSGTLSWAAAGATTTSDTSTNAERYIKFDNITSGAVTAVNHDTGLRYNPSTGSLTSAVFIGNVTGNTSGTAATVTTAAQPNITSLGTLTTLTVDSIIINGTNIGHTSDDDAIAISSGGVISFSATTPASAIGTAAVTIAGGIGVAADMWIGDDIVMDSDSAVIQFGDDQEIALTHLHNQGLEITSTHDAPLVRRGEDVFIVLNGTNSSSTNAGFNIIDETDSDDIIGEDQVFLHTGMQRDVINIIGSDGKIKKSIAGFSAGAI